MRARSLGSLATIILVLLEALPVAAQEGRRITYQGRITATNASVTAVRAKIFKNATGVTPSDQIWPKVAGQYERHEITPDSDGGFVIVLGASNIDSDTAGGVDLEEIDPDVDNLYLELELEIGTTEKVLLRPRQRIYPAFHAETVDIANKVKDKGILTPMIADGQVTGAKIANESITADHIDDGSILTSDIGPGEVISLNIRDYNSGKGGGGVANGDIRDDAIDSRTIDNQAVARVDIAPNALALDCSQVTNTDLTCTYGQDCAKSAACPSDRILTGGGCSVTRRKCNVQGYTAGAEQPVLINWNSIQRSYPDGNRWECYSFGQHYTNCNATGSYDLVARAICCKIPTGQ